MSLTLEFSQRLLNIKGALAKPLQHRIVTGVVKQPSLMLSKQAFSHSSPGCPSRALETKQRLSSVFYSIALQARGEVHFRCLIAIERKGFPQLAGMAVGPLKVRFVDQHDVSQFQKARFLGLYAVATGGTFNHHDAIGNGSTPQFCLTGPTVSISTRCHPHAKRKVAMSSTMSGTLPDDARVAMERT